MISTYDVIPEGLSLFIKSIRAIRRKYERKSEPWIINALASKLQRRAAEGYRNRLSYYDSLDAMLTDVKTQYGAYEGAKTVLGELRKIRQGPKEIANRGHRHSGWKAERVTDTGDPGHSTNNDDGDMHILPQARTLESGTSG